MKDFIPFLAFLAIIIVQRIIELFIARRNEKWMKQRGAIEFGRKHYRYIVWMHMLFFISLCLEKILFNRELSYIWPVLVLIFSIAQIIRIWAIFSLGKYWNTKIIVLPNAGVVRKGPYRYIKHPNYFVVSIELTVVPLLFGAYITAVLFTFLNFIMLSIRIPEEEVALKKLTEYEGIFQNCNRFLPKLLNKCDS
ncbi:MAG: isoprenylcysteine carboxyl methyltransferase family protein [Neobacillus sp.]